MSFLKEDTIQPSDNKLFWIGSTDFSRQEISQLEENFSIFFSATCEQCEQIFAFDPDLIVIEENPGTEQCLFCHVLCDRQNLGHLPVIYISGCGDEQKKMDLLRQGVYSVLTKPLAIDELSLILNNIITARKKYQLKLAPDHANITGITDPFYNKTVEVIYTHLSDLDFCCERLADLMCMSRVTLYKKLKKACQKSPIELIHSIRLNTAKEKIRAREGSIKQIAHAVGFNSVTYFTTLFKKEFGVTPSSLQ